MLDNANARSAVAGMVDPAARALLRVGLTPDHVTWIGTTAVVLGAVVLIAPGHLVVGGIVCGIIGLSDLLDGTMARLSGRVGTWGGFLDSTLDRIADAALVGAIAWYLSDSSAPRWSVAAALVALAAGQITSYIRAKAEALGATCRVGLAERTERTSLVLGGLILSGLHPLVLPVAMSVLAVASAMTVAQRIGHVRRQLVA